jgi:hypothetical protein
MPDSVAIFGASGPTVAFLVTVGLFAFGGACARLFWDASTDTFTVRRQIGFVGTSVVAAFALAFVLWQQAREYPAFLVGLATISALIGPADVLTILRDIFTRTLSGRGEAPK